MDDEKSERGTKNGEINLCLLGNSIEGEYDVSDVLLKDFKGVLEEVCDETISCDH